MKYTKVFYKIRAAIQARNPDGSRKYKYIKLVGSSRSSKTTSAIQNFYTEAWNGENKRLSVWRNEKKLCKDTVGYDMRLIFPTLPYYTPALISFNRSEGYYAFPSGSVIELCGTDDQNKVHGYNGDILWLNEPYDMSLDTFDQLDQRTNECVIIDMNPKEDHWSDNLEKNPRTIVIHSTYKDNPWCPIEQKIKIQSYQPVKMCQIVQDKILSEIEAKAYDMVKNPKGIPEKLLLELVRCIENERQGSASAYKWSVYGLGLKAERPNRILHWEEISDDDYNKIDCKRYYGVDWGTVDPWGILEAKYYDGSLYFHEKNYMSENNWRENVTILERQMIDNTEDEPNKEKGIVKFVFNKLNIYKKADIVCDTNRPLKIQALWDIGYDYATGAPKPAGSLIDGIDLLSDTKCYYTSSSLNLKYEQENYEREVDRFGKVLDTPCDKNNHLIDPSRYVALFLSMMGIIKRS